MYRKFIHQNSELGDERKEIISFLVIYFSVAKVNNFFEYEKQAWLAIHHYPPCVFWDSCGFGNLVAVSI